MQSITQAGLDPMLKDIGHLFQSSLNTSTFQNITQIVRILPPPRVWIGTKPGNATTQYFGDPARREIQAPQGAMHRASMGATELPSNWPEMQKTKAAKRVAKSRSLKVERSCGQVRIRNF